jgi:hypothetical protein
MSHENVDLVRQLQPGPDVDIAAFFRDEATARAALEAAAPLFDPSFEAITHGAIQGKHGHGPEGLQAIWLDWLEPWESYRTEIENIIDAGDQVVVLTRDSGRPVGADGEVAVTGAAIWTVRDGKLTRAEFFADRREALKAAGLGE